MHQKVCIFKCISVDGVSVVFVSCGICDSVLQDKHLEEAYEIKLMEELTLKETTQVSSITSTLYLMW